MSSIYSLTREYEFPIILTNMYTKSGPYNAFSFAITSVNTNSIGVFIKEVYCMYVVCVGIYINNPY